MRVVSQNDLVKLDLQLDMSVLFTKCHDCHNLISLGYIEKFRKEINQLLQEKLIANGLEEDGHLEINYFFTCPKCLKSKIITLRFNLIVEKQIMLFQVRELKRPQLLLGERK